MRRFLALARTAALESLAEPLSAVLFFTAALVIHLAPAFHYHQFGEPGRLARECGFSALLVFGLLFATPAAVRTVGRELESGTAAAALALGVSRTLFFSAKVCGVFAAFALFLAATAAATSLATFSSCAGALLDTASAAHVWGPGFALGLGATLVAFAGAALANRFRGARFCVTACLFVAGAQFAACAGVCTLARPAGSASLPATARLLVPAFAALAAGCAVFLTLAAALAVRLKPAVVTAWTAAAVLSSFMSATLARFAPWACMALGACVPEVGNFWLVDGLANGGRVGWTEAAPALCVSSCLIVLWLAVGSALLARREIP